MATSLLGFEEPAISRSPGYVGSMNSTDGQDWRSSFKIYGHFGTTVREAQKIEFSEYLHDGVMKLNLP